MLVVAAGQEAERAGNVPADLGRGAARQGYGRRATEPVPRGAQRSVARPEIVSPLGDAVGLVDRKECGANTLLLELGGEPREPLGRDVEQPEGPIGEPAPDGFPLPVFQRAVQRGRRDTPSGCGRDLILHERDQRGDDEGEAARDQRRHLEANRFPPAGGQYRQGIPAGEHGGDDRPLGGAKVAVTEMVAQEAAGFVHGHGHGTRCSVAARLLHPGPAATLPDTHRPPCGGWAASGTVEVGNRRSVRRL